MLRKPKAVASFGTATTRLEIIVDKVVIPLVNKPTPFKIIEEVKTAKKTVNSCPIAFPTDSKLPSILRKPSTIVLIKLIKGLIPSRNPLPNFWRATLNLLIKSGMP